MGTWGTGIFDDDVAGNVSNAFRDELATDVGVTTATERVLTRFADDLNDSDEGPIIYLVLAALQLQQGALTEDIRQRALQIISTGEGLDRWEEADPRDLQDRKRVLEELGEKLNQ